MSSLRTMTTTSRRGLTTIRRLLWPGEVPLAQLKREIEQGHRHFFARRAGHVGGGFAPSFKAGEKPSLTALARAYIAMGRPPRGTLQAMARGNGVSYASLASRIHKLRRAA